MVEKLLAGGLCGSLKDAVDETGGTAAAAAAARQKKDGSILARAQNLCSSTSRPDSPPESFSGSDGGGRRGHFLGPEDDDSDDENYGQQQQQQQHGQQHAGGGGGVSPTTKSNATSALFARALVSEVTDNPKTMNPTAMAEREKQLMRAMEKANNTRTRASNRSTSSPDGGFVRAVGTPGGISGPPGVLGALQNLSLRGEAKDGQDGGGPPRRVEPPNKHLIENRAQVKPATVDGADASRRRGKHTVTIGLSLSRRHSTLGHPDTVTRQTAFDFNELQDRQYKYVSSTDSSGWKAGGGERGGLGGGVPPPTSLMPDVSLSLSEDGELNGSGQAVTPLNGAPGSFGNNSNMASAAQQAHKIAAPDTVHIPILHIDCESQEHVDRVISSLASGELFIPHMSILPEALSVNGISPPDLVVRFGCERNEDLPPDEWPNWCLEFMHNQLYEYFQPLGARWEERPFQITLARKVRWKTVKHMNKFFAHSERVINAWRENGPQYLDPQLSYLEDGATPEEVARPHGIYVLRNGRPTNYFAPNFEPPYTTKMTRSLLMNVINKSWDKKRRDWSSEAIPRLVTPGMLLTTMCGCTDGNQGGFIATEATNRVSPLAQPYKSGAAAAEESGEYSEFEHLRDVQMQADKIEGVAAEQYKETSSAQHRDARGLSSSQNDTTDPFSGLPNDSDLPSDDRAPIPESSKDFPGDNSMISHAWSDSIIKNRSPNVVVESKGDGSKQRFFPSTPVQSGLVRDSFPVQPSSGDPALLLREIDELAEQYAQNTDAMTPPSRKSRRSTSRSGSRNRGTEGDGEKETGSSKAPSRALGTVAAASIGESQTTVPIKNGQGLLELEREQRKEREKERAEERKKMESLERMLQAQMKEKELNQKKMESLERKLLEQKVKEKERDKREKRKMVEREEEARALGQLAKEKIAKLQEQKRKERGKERERQEREKRMLVEREEAKVLEQSAKEKMAKEKKAEAKAKKLKQDKKRTREKERDKQIALIARAAEETEKAKAVVSKLQSQALDPPQVDEPKQLRSSTRSQSPSTQRRSNRSQSPSTQRRSNRSQSPSTQRLSNRSQSPSTQRRSNRSPSPSSHRSKRSPSPSTQRSKRSQSPSTQRHSHTRAYDMRESPSRKHTSKRHQEVSTSVSGETLEYSVDSSVYGGDCTNLVCTSTSKISKNTAKRQAEDFEVTESSSSGTADTLPSDEELFAFGWAKALDANSGSYYYFTLDRSQTVWVNPLLTLVHREAFADPPASAPASNASSSASSNNVY